MTKLRLADPVAFAAQNTRQDLVRQPRRPFVGVEGGERRTHRLAGLEADQPAAGTVEEHHPAVQRHHADEVVGLFHQRHELLALFLGAFAFAHIPANSGEPEGLARLVAKDFTPRTKRANAVIGPNHAEFNVVRGVEPDGFRNGVADSLSVFRVNQMKEIFVAVKQRRPGQAEERVHEVVPREVVVGDCPAPGTHAGGFQRQIQALVSLLQCSIALLDLRQHFVESFYQDGDFVVTAARRHPDRIFLFA